MIDQERVNRILRFIAQLKHTKSPWYGKPFILHDWQKKILVELYGTVNESGLRQYRQAFLFLPRKNGKSELAAALALYHLFADGCPGGEIYSAAADREQASLIFNVARDMVRQVPELRKRSKVIETQKRIVNYRNNSFYRAIPAEAASAHGYNASTVIIDELHTQPNRELYDVLTTSTGTRDEPMIISISTAGFDKQHSICGEVYNYAKKVKEGIVDDPSFYPVIYEADEIDDWANEKVWYKANPALGQFRKIEELQAMCKKAQAVPSLENTFKRLYLNIWTAQETRWLQMSKWDASAGEVDPESLRGRVCYGGLDLASTTDIAAFSLVFPMEDGSFKVLPYFWIPEENMRDRVNRDKVPYDVWARDGHIEATSGNVIHYAAIEQKIQELAEQYDIRLIAFDRWGAIQLVQDLEDVGFTVVGFGQGFASMNAPTKEFLNLILSKKLHHGGHPVLRWMADNVVVKEDPAGNVKPDKSKSTEKIDGIVATIMALDGAIRNQEGPSMYEERGILSF